MQLFQHVRDIIDDAVLSKYTASARFTAAVAHNQQLYVRVMMHACLQRGRHGRFTATLDDQLQQGAYLVDELSVDAPDGVASVPVELLRAGGLLPHTLHVPHALHVPRALKTGVGPRQARRLIQVAFGGPSHQQAAARALADQAV